MSKYKDNEEVMGNIPYDGKKHKKKKNKKRESHNHNKMAKEMKAAAAKLYMSQGHYTSQTKFDEDKYHTEESNNTIDKTLEKLILCEYNKLINHLKEYTIDLIADRLFEEDLSDDEYEYLMSLTDSIVEYFIIHTLKFNYKKQKSKIFKAIDVLSSNIYRDLVLVKKGKHKMPKCCNINDHFDQPVIPYQISNKIKVDEGIKLGQTITNVHSFDGIDPKILNEMMYAINALSPCMELTDDNIEIKTYIQSYIKNIRDRITDMDVTTMDLLEYFKGENYLNLDLIKSFNGIYEISNAIDRLCGEIRYLATNKLNIYQDNDDKKVNITDDHYLPKSDDVKSDKKIVYENIFSGKIPGYTEITDDDSIKLSEEPVKETLDDKD